MKNYIIAILVASNLVLVVYVFYTEKRQMTVTTEATATRSSVGSIESNNQNGASTTGSLASTDLAKQHAYIEPVEVRKIRHSSEYSKMKAAELAPKIDSQYGPLFARLHLSPQQLDSMRSKIIDMRMVSMEITAAADGSRLSHDEHDKLVKQGHEAIDAEIRAEFGDDVFSTYKQYNKTLTSRQELQPLLERLRYSGATTSQEQAEKFINAYSEQVDVVLKANGGVILSEPLESVQSRYSTVLKNSGTYLTPDQQKIVEDYFKERIAYIQQRTQVGNRLQDASKASSKAAN